MAENNENEVKKPEENVPVPEEKKEEKDEFEKGRLKVDNIRLFSYPKLAYFWPLIVGCLLFSIFTPSDGKISKLNQQISALHKEVAIEKNVSVPGGAQEQALSANEKELQKADKSLKLNIGIRKTFGFIFLLVFTLNILIITFDFNRGTSLAAILVFVVVFMAALLIGERYNIPVLHHIWNFITGLDIYASRQMYLIIGMILAILIVCGIFYRRSFDSWEFSSREIIHNHGFLSDKDRYDTHGVKVSKRITDIFEYILLFSGDIVLFIPREQREIVISDVVSINKKEKKISELLSKLDVRITTE